MHWVPQDADAQLALDLVPLTGREPETSSLSSSEVPGSSFDVQGHLAFFESRSPYVAKLYYEEDGLKAGV